MAVQIPRPRLDPQIEVEALLPPDVADLIRENAGRDTVWQFALPITPVRRVEHAVRLPANALVTRFTLLIQAAPAEEGPARALGQLTLDPAGANALERVAVLDFGQPLTVSRLEVPPATGLSIVEVQPWTGARFDGSVWRDGSAASAQLTTQVRTQRLRIRLSADVRQGFPAETALADQLIVHYADSPTDLQITLDDSTVVWRAPGPVQPSTLGAVNETHWTAEFKRRVDLTAALQAVTGDPLAGEDLRTFRFVLESQAAGLLSITAEPASVRRIRRVRFGGQTETALTFTEEGRQSVPFALPPGTDRRVAEVRLVAAAQPPEERTLPAVGPALVSDALLLLDPDRAVAARLTHQGLDALTGLRLALVAGPQGAECRVVAWAGGTRPESPLETATSEPLELEPGPALEGDDVPGEARWVSLRFPRPVPLDPAVLPWVVLVVSRGQVAWSLTAAAATQVLRGPPAGPWLPLPPVFDAGGHLAGQTPRLRQVGTAKGGAVALIHLQVGAASASLTPTRRGEPARVALTPAAAATTLEVECRGPAGVTLRDIDVITEEALPHGG